MVNSKFSKDRTAGNTAGRILENSMRLFLEKGYHGTSIDEISQAAGLTKGAIYWHFKSKEDLLRTIVDEFEKSFLDGLVQAVEQVKGTILDKMEKYFRYTAAFAYHNKELCVSFTTLSGELVGARHPIEREIRRINKKYQNFISNLIAKGKRKRIFKKEIDPDLTAFTIIAFHAGILLHWNMNRNEIHGEAFANTYKDIILNGLRA